MDWFYDGPHHILKITTHVCVLCDALALDKYLLTLSLDMVSRLLVTATVRSDASFPQ